MSLEIIFHCGKFINESPPVLRDLTSSFRQGDWNFNLSFVYCAIILCFAFDCVNYKQWLPIYYEECLALEKKYPENHASFLKGDFFVQHLRKR